MRFVHVDDEHDEFMKEARVLCFQDVFDPFPALVHAKFCLLHMYSSTCPLLIGGCVSFNETQYFV